MDAHMNGRTLERTNAQTNGLTDRQIHARRDAWMDAYMNRRMLISFHAQIFGRKSL